MRLSALDIFMWSCLLAIVLRVAWLTQQPAPAPERPSHLVCLTPEAARCAWLADNVEQAAKCPGCGMVSK